MATKKCGAKTRSGGKCNKSAGWGTDHNGTGKCKLHGGASKGPPKGTQNALRHGIYARLFKPEELDAAADMAGNIDTELAIARLQLAALVEQMHKQGDMAYLEQVEEKTLATDGDDQEAQHDKIKRARAKDTAAAGEYYDPDEDDDFPEKSQESGIIERKKIYKRRDFQTEYARLTALIARLEVQRMNLQVKQVELELAKKKGEQDGGDDTDNLTDEELDTLFSKLIED